MPSIVSVLAKFLYPLRRHLHKWLRAGKVISDRAPLKNPSTTIYDFSIEGIDGNQIDLAKFQGKKMLLVNTASECGFTPQYSSLQKLSELYKDQLVVIGFPANDFGAQEPGSETEILNFCQRNYGVTFPLSRKIDVTGPDKHEIFQWLTRKELNGWNDRDPNWNFCKYLIDENGRLANFFSHKMDPLDGQLISKIVP